LLAVAPRADPRALDLRGLYQAHAPFLRASIQRLGGPCADADDLLHEVFIVALQRADTFEGRSAARTWLYGIALKVVAAHRRKQKLRRFLGLDALPPGGEPVDGHTPATHLDAALARASLYAALDSLSEKKRTVFILFELEGRSGEEIARLVGCPLKTVWTRLFHARAAVQRYLSRAEAQAQAGLIAAGEGER